MLTGNTGQSQLPMKQRAENVLAELHKRLSVRRSDIDEKVLKHLLKKGLVKIERYGTTRVSHNVVVPVTIPEEVKEKVSEPYAKRNAARLEAKEARKAKANKKKRSAIPALNVSEFYVELSEEVNCYRHSLVLGPGIYLFQVQYHLIGTEIQDTASRIWGVHDDGTVFYVKSGATSEHNKARKKVNMEEFTWIKLQAINTRIL